MRRNTGTCSRRSREGRRKVKERAPGEGEKDEEKYMNMFKEKERDTEKYRNVFQEKERGTEKSIGMCIRRRKERRGKVKERVPGEGEGRRKV